MIDYLQPEFYRFNEDSLRLVKWVLSKANEAGSILDLGAGCGVIGIELSRQLRPKTLTLVEAQPEYSDLLKNNCEHFLPPETYSEIEVKKFSEWFPERKYDLIVSNPPYFLPGHGERNADIRKETARSFILDNWQIFLSRISEALSEKGKAWLVVRDDKRIIQELNRDSSLAKKIHQDKNLLFIELSRLNKN